MKKNIIIILIVVIAAIFLRYISGVIGEYMSTKKIKMQPAPSVQVEPIGEEEIIRSFQAPGRVTSKYQVNVLARISGYLQKSYFKEGDYVKEGQVLFQIEPNEFINTANVAKANVANTRAQLEYAEKQLARASELVKKDYIAKAQYDQILSQRDALRAQLASAQAAYQDSQRNYSYTMVKSPVNGRVGIITVTVGNYVSPASGPLTTINSTDPIYVTFPLDSNDFDALAKADMANYKNRKVELYFNNGEKYDIDGVQDFLDNKIDQSTGTVTLRATFKNPNNRLLHGEFVTVKLYSNNKVKVPVVHQAAVQENQAGKYVYKLDDKDLPQLTYIKVGQQTGDYWVVTEGLNVGDRVITDGLQKVTPGHPVTIVTSEEMAKIKKQETQPKKDK